MNQKARRVELLLMDVDGVLTDGRIWYVPSGDRLEEVKSFNVADGAGITLAHRSGLLTGIISGRSSRIVVERARELGIEEVHIGVRDKSAVLDEVVRSRSVSPENAAFIGDDVSDIPARRRVGFPVAVANASDDVKPHAVYLTSARGGDGAVREVIELILKAQGKWDSVMGEFLR